MTDVIMPQMGESIAEGTVTKWLKKVGDKVERDEPLFEISTDKVDAEEGAAVAAPAPAAPTPVPAPAAPAPSAVAAAAPLPLVARVEPTPTPVAPAPPPAASISTTPAKPRAEMTVEELRQTRSSPVVRKIAAEHAVDIRGIQGTGLSGRVTKQDILGHLQGRPAAAAAPAPQPVPAAPSPAAAAATPVAPAAQPAVSPVPAYRPDERVEIVPMSPIRRKTAEHMVLSRRVSAHVSTVWEIDMTRVDQLRAKHREAFEQRSGVRLTYLPFILKATVDALKAFPILNASVEGDSIVYKKDVNLGMAVALDWGLIVPVIRNADEKNILGLARTVNDLAERARTKRLKVDEVQGGTFTITNPGVFGSLYGTPIINQPQVAILCVGAIEKRPVIRDDAIAIRTMCYFALTFDHRIVDGSDGDRFMAHLKKSLQEFDEASL